MRPAGFCILTFSLGLKTLHEEDLPFAFKSGKGKVIVKRFTDQGISIQEQDTFDDPVTIELYRLSKTIYPDPVNIPIRVPDPTVVFLPPTPWQRAKSLWSRFLRLFRR